MAVVIFDLDGTLIDSAPDIQGAVNEMLAAEGQSPLDLATVTSFIGNGLPKLVERVIRHHDMDMAQHARLTADTLAIYNQSDSELTRLYPHVIDTLKTLKAQGHRMGICTNKPLGPALHVLLHLDLGDFFDVVIGGDSTDRKKPDPMPLQRAMADMSTETVLYVGDSEIDAETAVNTGQPFALFTEGYRKRDIADIPHTQAFSDFRDLPGILARIQG
ncbi:phosphoglycolate phosphatase [Shimia thalassica]|uniref:phosphoglycolate phosphatase n=1 Tax=Shimia thalassica TaxID=1715693 RepID=UPI0026E1B9B5|nr:phosphoglycolate phosphatase [Shimia thalassica]MDO6478251.1 phosphoglycolate phosphatase [Shimia thalassica]